MRTTQLGIHARKARDIRYAIDPRDRNRLVLSTRRGGCATIAGLLILWLAAAIELEMFRAENGMPFVVSGLIVGGLGALFFAKRAIVFDRARHRIERGWHLVGTGVVTSSEPLVGSSIAIRETIETRGSGEIAWPEAGFDLSLADGERTIALGRMHDWEEIRQIAEAVSAFLSLPLVDRVAGTTTPPDRLDVPLIVRERREARDDEPPPKSSATVSAGDDGSAEIRLPSPGGEGVLLTTWTIFLFWTVPAFFVGNLPFALFPVAVGLAFWVKVRFGLGAVVFAEPGGITVENHGLFIIRIRKFATHEIEDLLVRAPEQGGVRGLYDFVADAMLVVRSDRMAARVGWGLSRDELRWIRGEILEVIARGDPSAPADVRAPADQIPVMGHGARFPVLLGFFTGIVLSSRLGGDLAICLALPFLEEVVSVGSLLGALIGLHFSRWRRDARPYDRTLVTALYAALLFLLLFAGRHPLVEPYPTFDEIVVAGLPRIPRVVWLGWIPVATVANALAAAIVAKIVAAPLRWARSPGDRARQALDVAGKPRMPLRPLRSYLPAGWADLDYATLFGGSVALLTGVGIVFISFFGPDERFNAPRWVVAAAGGAFLFAGTAILPQAFPLLETTREVVSRLSAALLLTSFGAVAAWAAVSGAIVFAPGALILFAMAAASWRSLWKVAWRATEHPDLSRQKSGGEE